MGEGITRRRFIAGIVAGVAATAAGCSSGDADVSGAPTTAPTTGGPPTSGPRATTTTTAPVPDLPVGLFALGVASGDPLPGSVILWTRLAPDPVAGGGMPDADVPVAWEVSTDEAFSDVVVDGVATATPAFAHSVHVDVAGLEPDTAYFYRFTVGDETSPVARTRTAPAPDADVRSLRFVFASCQAYTDGYYTAWAHAARERPDLVVFLGDYIYEGGGSGVRSHDGDEIVSLDDYRNRYGLYKSDADLQAAHAAAPWIVTWDDHEVENNHAAGLQEDPGDGVDFAARRAAAYQAYYEHHPVRIDPPEGDSLGLYRGFDWGSLVRFSVLDGRQYRSDQPCGGAFDFGQDCPERSEEDRTMLGAEQEEWLGGWFNSSAARWNVLANQTVMTPVQLGPLLILDQWDGYPAARRRLLGQIADSGLANPVVITGDIHAAGVGLVSDGIGAEAVATELVGTSISSTFPAQFAELVNGIVGDLPSVQWFDTTRRGYTVCDVTPDTLTATYRVVSTIEQPEAEVETARTFVIRSGTVGATEA